MPVKYSVTVPGSFKGGGSPMSDVSMPALIQMKEILSVL
jgi:hypothetical protein